MPVSFLFINLMICVRNYDTIKMFPTAPNPQRKPSHMGEQKTNIWCDLVNANIWNKYKCGHKINHTCMRPRLRLQFTSPACFPVWEKT